MQFFDDGNVFVRGAGRGVDEEVVGAGWPEDVGEELADHGGLFGAAPDDGGGAGGEEEGEGESMEGAAGSRRWVVAVCVLLAICGGVVEGRVDLDG